MNDFFKKYNDPRWQKKRLEMFKKANWRCQRCDCDDEQLNLHHKAYKANTNPWDYEDHWFRVLCDVCHHDEKDAHHQVLLLDSLFLSELNEYDIWVLCLALKKIGSNEYLKVKFKDMVDEINDPQNGH